MSAPRHLSSRDREARRVALRSVAVGALLAGLGLAGFWPISPRAAERLRPPGAIPEADFLAACIKCGQCVQVCPVEAIRLGDIDEGFGVGVPFIDARAQACDFSCDATQCILACPTGALSHHIAKKEEVRMGVAVLAAPERCLALRGEGLKRSARGPTFPGLLRYEEIDRWSPIPVADYAYDLPLCDLCVRECPIANAIALAPVSADPADPRRRPVVDPAICVGCGTCEMLCPAEPAAIVIVPSVAAPGAAAHG